MQKIQITINPNEFTMAAIRRVYPSVRSGTPASSIWIDDVRYALERNGRTVTLTPCVVQGLPPDRSDV